MFNRVAATGVRLAQSDRVGREEPKADPAFFVSRRAVGRISLRTYLTLPRRIKLINPSSTTAPNSETAMLRMLIPVLIE